MNDELNFSSGYVDKIIDDVAWGNFTDGQDAGQSFDLPSTMTIDGHDVEIEIGNFVKKLNTIDDETGQYYWFVENDDIVIVLGVREENNGFEIQNGCIVKKDLT